MDNNLLTSRANNFSIASLITAHCYHGEDSSSHSMMNSIEPNFTFNNSAFDQIINNNINQEEDIFPVHLISFTETNNKQYDEQQIRKDKTRSIDRKQPKKTPSTARHMDGWLYQS